MTAVVLGARGQLGQALLSEFPGARAVSRDELDVTDSVAVRDFSWDGVDVVLNAAAWTAVDAAEDPAHRSAVFAVNADAVASLAEASRRHGFVLVHISSEYVFDGRHAGSIPEDAQPSPLSVYGRSKAAGDEFAAAADRHYLIRTTWLVGNGGNFVRTMVSLADRGICPAVVDDQIGRLTFAADLAAGIAHLQRGGAPFGTYNLTGGGQPASWADVAREVFRRSGRAPEDVRRVSTAEYYAGKTGIAPRPANSVLDLRKIQSTGFEPVDWRTGLAEYLRREAAQAPRSSA